MIYISLLFFYAHWEAHKSDNYVYGLITTAICERWDYLPSINEDTRSAWKNSMGAYALICMLGHLDKKRCLVIAMKPFCDLYFLLGIVSLGVDCYVLVEW